MVSKEAFGRDHAFSAARAVLGIGLIFASGHLSSSVLNMLVVVSGVLLLVSTFFKADNMAWRNLREMDDTIRRVDADMKRIGADFQRADLLLRSWATEETPGSQPEVAQAGDNTKAP